MNHKLVATYGTWSVFFLCVSGILSCASQSGKNNPSESTIIITKLGKNVSSEENKSKTYLLYVQKPNDGDQAARKYNYAVVKKSTNQVVSEGFFQLGYVKWINDSSIEVLSLPSITEPEEGKYKKIIVVTREQN